MLLLGSQNMIAERAEKKERKVTKTILLGEFVVGSDSRRTGHRYLAITERRGNSYLTHNLQALSWGNDPRNSGAEREEFVIATVLGYIDKQYNCGGLKSVLQLLTDKGEKGIELSLSSNMWSKMYAEDIPLRVMGETMDIPIPPPLKV